MHKMARDVHAVQRQYAMCNHFAAVESCLIACDDLGIKIKHLTPASAQFNLKDADGNYGH